MAEALKPAGFRTCMAGKWHMTTKLQPKGENSCERTPLSVSAEKPITRKPVFGGPAIVNGNYLSGDRA